MSFFAILFALLIEQVRPLGAHNPIHTGLRVWARWVSRNFDAGKPQHGWVAWALAVVAPVAAGAGDALAAAVLRRLAGRHGVERGGAVRHAGLPPVQPPLHRHPRRAGGGRRDARAPAAGAVAAGGCQRTAAQRDRAPRDRVFGAGRAPPRVRRAGLVLGAGGLRPRARPARCCTAWPNSSRATGATAAACRPSRPARRCSRRRRGPGRRSTGCRRASRRMAFAVVGSFEEAIDCWRNYAQRFPNDNDGVILAATSGAVNVRLGGEALQAGLRAEQPPAVRGGRPSAPSRRWTPPARRAARPRSRTCAASSAWCGARWCCGWCCWRC